MISNDGTVLTPRRSAWLEIRWKIAEVLIVELALDQVGIVFYPE